MSRYIDLHIHSTHSDGIYSPEKLVTMAVAQNLSAIAIADHDSVDGIDEAIRAAQGHDIEVIPAVELSVEYKSYHDVHLLGYYIDHNNLLFKNKLTEFKRQRDIRGRSIIDNINAKLTSENKGNISYEEVLSLADGSLGRPHIARVLVGKGFTPDINASFSNYLEPCNIPKKYFPIIEAIQEIHRLGGLSILAHPLSISTSKPTLHNLIIELAALGLDGIEVYNNMCYKNDMEFFESLAFRNGLAVTGGSDYHGFDEDVKLAIGRGNLAIPYRLVKALKDLLLTRDKPYDGSN